MSEKRGRHDDPADRSPADDAELSKRLNDLDRRIGASRSTTRQADEFERAADASAHSGMGKALRLGADFVAGVVVGGAIGYGFDRFFKTSPWGLVVFVLLGFGAGVLSVMRSVGVVKQRPGGGDDFSRRS